MAFLKNSWIIFLSLIPSVVQACPACRISESGRFTNQTLLILAVMGVLPLVLAVAIGFKIYRLCRPGPISHEKK